MEARRVSVVGLGKLGLPMAAAMAARGCTVVATDSNPDSVAAVQAWRTPRPLVEERGLADTFAEARGNLIAMEDTACAVAVTDVTFVIVPTPSGDDGAFVNDHVLAACDDVGRGIARKDRWHLVSITSTVMPGSSEEIIAALEKHGARHGIDFGFCYSPLFIALGDVLGGFLRPDMILVGAADRLGGAELTDFYKEICENDPPVVVTDPLSAELAKLLLNSFLTTKITFANFIGWIANRTGAAAADIVRLIGLDSRVNPKFFSPGPPFGGPCFPRDNVALAAFLDAEGLPSCFPLCVDDLNFYGALRLAEIASDNAGTGGKVAVLGRGYKTGSPVLDDSPSSVLVELLVAKGHPVTTTDPMFDGLTAEQAIRGAGAVVIMHRDARYARLNFEPGQAVVDPWGMFLGPPKGTHLIQIGGGP
jgi:UDPglucose 6-dehydrogenase